MTDKDKPNPSEKPTPTQPQQPTRPPARDGGMQGNVGTIDIPAETSSDEE